MKKIINKFTNIKYEYIHFNGDNYTEVYNFIKENLNIPVACVKNKNIIECINLEMQDYTSIININDYIIRDMKNDFNIIDAEIFKSNFISE